MSPSSAPNPEDGSLEDGLHQGGRRLTPQRKRVLELFELRGAGCHLSAEEVHQQLVNLKLKVSLATVYRTPSSGRHGFSARAGTQRGGASV